MIRNGFYQTAQVTFKDWAKIHVVSFQLSTFSQLDSKPVLDDFVFPPVIMDKLQVKHPAVNEKRLSAIKNSFPTK